MKEKQRKELEVKVVNRSKNPLPQYQTEGSAGMDLRASTESAITLKPGERALIPTGISIAIPEGYEAQVRPRSGLALKYGISCCNTPGTIDSDYRGEIGVILINHGSEDFTVNNGDRIAQIVFNKTEQAVWVETTTLDATERNSGGYGHSGIE